MPTSSGRRVYYVACQAYSLHCTMQVYRMPDGGLQWFESDAFDQAGHFRTAAAAEAALRLVGPLPSYNHGLPSVQAWAFDTQGGH